MAKILISTCLLELKVRFDSRDKKDDVSVEYAKNGNVIFIAHNRLVDL